MIAETLYRGDKLKQFFCETPSAADIAWTLNTPWVSVPVLSNTTVFIWVMASR